jgi:hypothetical protein
VRDRRFATAAVLAAALLAGACGSDDDEAEEGSRTEAIAEDPLRVEGAEGPRGTELIVYVIDADSNAASVAGGKKRVTLRCFDRARKPIVEKAHPWPFTDTDQGVTDPHIHQRVPRSKVTDVSRCELEGTRGPLSGELTTTGFQ